MSEGIRSLNQLPSHITGNGGSWLNAAAGIFMRAVKTPMKLKMKLMRTVLPMEIGIALMRMNFIEGGLAPALRARTAPSFPNGMMKAITAPKIMERMMFEA